jgi:hypothetical protein
LAVVVRWLVALGLLIAATGTASHVSAQQPTFPLLQEGTARTAFVSGTYRACLERQKGYAENASLSTPELGAFCVCYGRAIADVISGADYEALTLGATQPSESFLKKTQIASTICLTRMTASAQRTAREQEIVALRNRCLREYHPEDTDYAAAVVRERFCGCFSEAVAKSGTKPKSPTEAMGYCSRQLSAQ